MPAVPGAVNSGCMFATLPRAKPSAVKIAKMTSSPKVVTFWKTPLGLMPR
jgi:hypothetical protein